MAKLKDLRNVGQRSRSQGKIKWPWCHFKRFHYSSMYAKYEVSISHGAKVMAKVVKLFATDRQAHRSDKTQMHPNPFWGQKTILILVSFSRASFTSLPYPRIIWIKFWSRDKNADFFALTPNFLLYFRISNFSFPIYWTRSRFYSWRKKYILVHEMKPFFEPKAES